MKDFLKHTLATIVGVIATLVIITFITVAGLMGIVSASDSKTVTEENSLMKLSLDGKLVERYESNPLDFVFAQFSGNDDSQTYGLDEILGAIDKARQDSNIRGIYLETGSFDAEPASLEAIRRALTEFKESGKFIVAYADDYEQTLYYVASVADEVIMNPQGSLNLHGLAGQVMLYRDLMDKLGIKMEIFKVGTFKSAVEPYMLNHISDANREQMEAYMGSIWGHIKDQIAASRNLTAERIDELADNGLAFSPAEETVQCGLVDTLMYKIDVRDHLKQRLGIDKDDDLEMYGVHEMMNSGTDEKAKGDGIIAVYYASGEIDGSANIMSADAGIVSDKVTKDIRSLQEDDDVRAVVLRVNSPGGSAYGSEQIWHALSQLKTTKPLVVSMGDCAASGGYYISCVADSIVAEPTTITGSIGIFGMMPDLSGLMGKLGVNTDAVQTNQYGDMGDPFRPMTEGEKTMMQRNVENGYDLFLTRCADGRHMTKEQIDKIAQGRVWTGEMAQQLGLVDKLGSLDDAISIAQRMSGVEQSKVKSYPEPEDDMMSLIAGSGKKLKQRILGSSIEGDAARLYDDIKAMSSVGTMDRLQARMPYDVRIR